MNRLPIAFAALVLSSLAALAAEKTFKPDAQGRIEFDTPSLNLCCVISDQVAYYPEGSGSGPLLTCTRVAPQYWIIELRPNGKVIPNKDPGEVPGCGYGEPIGNVLGYGDTVKASGYSCSMAKNGITCTSGKKGFRLSRKGLVNVR